MKKAKKFLLNLLAFASVTALAVGFSACKQSDKTVTEGDFTFEKIDGKDEYALIEYNKDSLQTNVVIPDTYNGTPITEISLSAFYYCDNLTSVTIPDSITTIGETAFYHCDSLTSITIPDSVTTIGEMAFFGCNNVEAIYYMGDITNWCAIDLDTFALPTIYSEPAYTNDGAELYIDNQLIAGDLVIPDGVKNIGRNAFYGCVELTSITIPDSVTTIGDWAFKECGGLTSITIPDSVTTIGDWAFDDCGSLTYNVKDNKKYLGNENNPYIYLVGMIDKTATSVTIDNTCKFIGSEAFSFFDNLTNVTIPDSVTTIGNSAFYGCDKLTNVTIPDSVTTIGDWAFYGCDNLTSATIGNSVTAIGNSAFYGCDNLTSVTMPAIACYSIPRDALQTVIINGGDTIGNRVFYDCDSLISVTIGDTVTTIGESAFVHCENLTRVIFEDTSSWYRTENYADWENKVNGEHVDVGNAKTAADLLADTDYNYWWYKL